MEDFSYLNALIQDELEEAVEEIGEGYRHVWVVAEMADGRFTTATLEGIGQGRDIADQFGVYLYGVLIGSDLDESLAQVMIQYGVDKLFLLDDPALAQYQVETYTKALADLINKQRPEIVLLTASPWGNDLAPRLAQRLNTGLFSHCLELSLDMAERQLLGTSSRLGGDCFHIRACPEARPQIATLEPGAFRPADQDQYRRGEVERVAVDLEGISGKLNWVDWDMPALSEAEAAVTPQPIPLAKSRIIVSAGRGLKDAPGFALAQQLAEALGGQITGSRGALDEGWIDEEQQVGVTGQTVRPDLYIACGISGAIHHVVGMQDARFVVAINRDNQAPIMQVANVIVVGDAEEVVGALVNELCKNQKE